MFDLAPGVEAMNYPLAVRSHGPIGMLKVAWFGYVSTIPVAVRKCGTPWRCTNILSVTKGRTGRYRPVFKSVAWLVCFQGTRSVGLGGVFGVAMTARQLRCQMGRGFLKEISQR